MQGDQRGKPKSAEMAGAGGSVRLGGRGAWFPRRQDWLLPGGKGAEVLLRKQRLRAGVGEWGVQGTCPCKRGLVPGADRAGRIESQLEARCCDVCEKG